MKRHLPQGVNMSRSRRDTQREELKRWLHYFLVVVILFVVFVVATHNHLAESTYDPSKDIKGPVTANEMEPDEDCSICQFVFESGINMAPTIFFIFLSTSILYTLSKLIYFIVSFASLNFVLLRGPPSFQYPFKSSGLNPTRILTAGTVLII